jgi:hypothetical protein
MTRLDSIPLVLGAETPFVLGVTPSPLPYLEVAGRRLRRGPDRVTVEQPVGAAYVHTTLLTAAGTCYVMASAGALLADLWAAPDEVLRAADRACGAAVPHLAAAAQGRSAAYTGDDLPARVKVRVVPPPPPPGEPASLGLIARTGTLSANLDAGLVLSGYAARGVVDVLNEFATLRPGGSIDPWRTLVGDGTTLVAHLPGGH